MTEITVQIDGMMCGMCEAHINDAIRRALPVKKVSSSHKRGQAVLVTGADISDDAITETVAQTGYTVRTISRKPYEKTGFFSCFRK